MNRFKKWLIKKLGGFVYDEKINPIIIQDKRQIERIRAIKKIDSRILPHISLEIIHNELCLKLAEELINYTKIETENNDLITTFIIDLEFIPNEDKQDDTN